MQPESRACFSGLEYTSDEVFRRDLVLLARQWIYVGHASELPEIGCYIVRSVCGESIVLVRTDSGVKGFFNFCRHRGSTICTAEQGRQAHFVCPYHGWTYGLDGALHRQRSVGVAADRPDLDLLPVGVTHYRGLIFVALAPHPSNPFAVVEHVLEPLVPWHGLGEARVAARRSYPTRANWKLVVENFLECFHCHSNHPELCSVYSHPKYTGTLDPALGSEFLREAAHWERNTRRLGHPTGGTSAIDSAASQFCVAFRMPIRPGALSLSADGTALAPLMGKFTEYDGGETFGLVGPLLHFSLANDHAMLIRIDPTGALETHVELIWLVRQDAVEGQHYDAQRLTWLWDATVRQDRVAVERAQAGVRSRFYVPGSFTDLELESARFARWYRRQIETQDAEPGDHPRREREWSGGARHVRN